MLKEEQHKKDNFQTEETKSDKVEICDGCHGSGTVGDGTCSACNGSGIL
jgi:DnaJ-class molecular chaperone